MDELSRRGAALRHISLGTKATRWQAMTVALAIAIMAALANLTVSVAGAYEIEDVHPRPYTTAVSTTQAGGHPDITVDFTVENHTEPKERGEPEPCLCGDALDITSNLPAGVIGNPNAIPQCTQADFGNGEHCSPDTQVGVAKPEILFNPGNPGRVFWIYTPVYNLEPHPGQAALLGVFLPFVKTPGFIVFSARTGGDFGLTATFKGIEHLVPADGFTLNLWGVPGEARHDPDRCTSIAGVGFHAGECTSTGPSNAELKPFLDNPTTCEGPLSSSLEVLFYSHKVTHQEYPWATSTGCDQLTFNPSLFAQPTTNATDSPSGLEVDLRVPQLQSPSAPSPSEIRATTLTLPKGMSLNPSAADGKTSCSDSQARIGTEEEAQCPEISKVGTVSLTSTVLPGPLPGSVYLGEPMPGDRYRIIITANGFATHVKLVGSIRPDPQTGQLVASFQDLPQSPFSDFNLHFFGSERGVLTTPTQCGTYPVTSTFTPWDEALPEQTSTQFFTLDRGPNGEECPGSPRPFKPGFEAAVTDATGGAHSPFFINLSRPDGSQNFAGLTLTAPPGFSATLSGIPYCSDAALAAVTASSYSGIAEQQSPSCPAASRIGTATAGAGSGTHPLYLQGNAYLAGPYKGAPLSLAVITPAVSGPYDLGNVVVRAALRINSETAQVTAVSDPLPQIVEGIPLRLRSILVNLDRKDFVLNPTNCDPFSVTAQVEGDQGTMAGLSFPFQVGNCAPLPFAPKLSLKLTGGLGRLGHPAIHAVLRADPGEANPHSISVTLPPSELLDNAHIGNVCTKVDFAAQTCPAGSQLGHVEVTTPLLDQPLTGSAYLRSSDKGLPNLALDLNGQIHIEAIARIDAVNRGLRTTFKTVPDVPLGTVTLDLFGGTKGLIRNSESLCGAHKKAAVTMTGQNGRSSRREVPLQASCGKSARKHKHKRHHRAKVGG